MPLRQVGSWDDDIIKSFNFFSSNDSELVGFYMFRNMYDFYQIFILKLLKIYIYIKLSSIFFLLLSTAYNEPLHTCQIFKYTVYS